VNDTVLVIEDDLDILELLIDFLADHGIEAISVPPRPAAIRSLAEAPGAVLIDLMLPGTSGIEMAAQVRDVFPDAPLLAMSASRLMLEVAAGSGLFDAHLAKPFDLSYLLESVRAALALSRHWPSLAVS
jgi:two-component system nitrogen regulation response regulator GlnG